MMTHGNDTADPGQRHFVAHREATLRCGYEIDIRAMNGTDNRQIQLAAE